MNSKTIENETFDCAPSLAAMQLASQLGGTRELWLYRLANWRRTDRKSPIPFGKTEAGNPTYSLGGLNDFIAKQLEKQAFVAEANASLPSVRAAAIAKLDTPGERPHVRVSFNINGVSQSVFAITATGARQLADMLTKAAATVEHVAPAAFEPPEAA